MEPDAVQVGLIRAVEVPPHVAANKDMKTMLGQLSGSVLQPRLEQHGCVRRAFTAAQQPVGDGLDGSRRGEVPLFSP